MFTSTHNNGFSMTFENGFTISVRWGIGNYCERRSMSSYHPHSDMKIPQVKSTDAEIAIWDKEGTWFNFGSDTVKGWCSVDEVATWIGIAREAKTLDDITEMAIHFGMMVGSQDE